MGSETASGDQAHECFLGQCMDIYKSSTDAALCQFKSDQLLSQNVAKSFYFQGLIIYYMFGISGKELLICTNFIIREEYTVNIYLEKEVAPVTLSLNH